MCNKCEHHFNHGYKRCPFCGQVFSKGVSFNGQQFLAQLKSLNAVLEEFEIPEITAELQPEFDVLKAKVTMFQNIMTRINE